MSLTEQTLRILAHTFYPVAKFESLVLVEPMLIISRHFKGSGRKLRLDEGALVRRDFWESKEEAWLSLSAKGMKEWDKRVVKLFVVSQAAPDFRPFPFCTADHSHQFFYRSLVFGRQLKMIPTIDPV